MTWLLVQTILSLTSTNLVDCLNGDPNGVVLWIETSNIYGIWSPNNQAVYLIMCMFWLNFHLIVDIQAHYICWITTAHAMCQIFFYFLFYNLFKKSLKDYQQQILFSSIN